jgi:molybdopterin biosynthesis enzyme
MRAMGASPGHAGEAVPAALAEGAGPIGALTQFRPVTCGWDAQGRMRAEWVKNQGSGDFSGWARADGFVELEAGDAAWEAGRVAPLWRF